MSCISYPPYVILCIDDEPVGLEVRRLILESAGYRVMTTSSGNEGVRLSNDGGVDLVVVDYRLRERKGTEIARDIKRAKPNLPVILLSGEVEPPECLEYVDKFLAKLEYPPVFLSEIAAILKRARESAA